MAAPKNLDEALLQLQADPPVLVKDKKGQVGNQKTRYADLVQVNAVVLSRLNALGVVYVCAPVLAEGQFGLNYRLTHVASSTGIEGRYPLKLAENPMQMGSAITYARRYVLLAITGVAAEDEDDDGGNYAGAGQRYAQRANQRQRADAAPAADPGKTAQRAERPRAARPPLPGENPDGPVDQKQHRHMHALWRELGFDGEENRDTRLSITAKLAGVPDLNSSADLTRAQADAVIAALIERRDEQRAGGDR